MAEDAPSQAPSRPARLRRRASARVLKPGAPLRFATDWADYANRALAALTQDGHFEWTAQRADDWRKPPVDHVTTRYQEKRLGDCEPVFLDFVRV